MRPYAEVVGDPVAHSKSPALHRFWLKELGLDFDYRATRIRPGELRAYFDDRRADRVWRGCNLTAPLKEQAIPLVDALSNAAAAIGAVNIIYPDKGRLVGDNSDVDGVAVALHRDAIIGRNVALIGAGGAARAALHHLLQAQVNHVRILVRRPKLALTMLAGGHARITVRAISDRNCLARTNIVVNASSLGMAGAPMPGHLLEAISQKREGLVFDMVYDPFDTELLEAARASGLAAVDGLVMLIRQADTAFRRFFGEAPPRQHDRELRLFLAGK